MDTVGNAGTAIMSAASLAGFAIFGSYTVAYLAHCFTSIADATAGGADEVTWPDEPFLDRLGRGVGFAWLWVVTVAPLYVLGLVCSGGRAYAATFFALAASPLLFPVVYLSVHESGSMFAIISPAVIARLAKRPDNALGFMAAAMPTCVLFLAGIWLVQTRGLTGAIAGAGCLAYSQFVLARLMGRLAQKLERISTKPRVAGVNAESKPTRPPLATLISDPWAESEPTPDPAAESYALRSPDAPEPEPPPAGHSYKRVWVEEGADEPYALGDEVKPVLLPASLQKVDEYEMQLIAPRRSKIPRRPWLTGTWSFPLRPTSLGRLALLTLGLTLTAWCWQVIWAAATAG